MALIDKATSTLRPTYHLKPVVKDIEEEIELALAWTEDRISNYQMLVAIGGKVGPNGGTRGQCNRVYSFVATRLREGLRRGIIQRGKRAKEKA